MSQFTPSGSSGTTTNVVVNGATSPFVANVSIVSANTEYSYTFPTNTKKFHIKLRDGQRLQLAYISGDTGTTYVTLPAYNLYTEENITLTSVTLYFQSPVGSNVAEIIYWT